MNYQQIAVICLLVVALTGCTLSKTSTSTTAMEPIPTTLISITDLPVARPTPQSTATVGHNPAINQAPADVAVEREIVNQDQFVRSDCVIQHPEWPIYTVQPGDTLAQIEASVGLSANVLAQVNCLVDVNLIYVGQLLHIPTIPMTPPPIDRPPGIPLVDIGPQPEFCVVRPNNGETAIYGAGVEGGPAAILVGSVRFVRQADYAYVVELPQVGLQGWVYAADVHFEGASCPNETIPPMPTNPLPIMGNDGTPPENGCSVIGNPDMDVVYIYYGAADAFAPIAILHNYVTFMAQYKGGYEVIVPGWDRHAWIPIDGVLLVGNGFPDN